METLLILSSPLWPLALLAAYEWVRVSTDAPRGDRKGEQLYAEGPTEDFQHLAWEPEDPAVFQIDEANRSAVARERAAVARERAMRMGLHPSASQGRY
jgi:hypothetical protein